MSYNQILSCVSLASTNIANYSYAVHLIAAYSLTTFYASPRLGTLYTITRHVPFYLKNRKPGALNSYSTLNKVPVITSRVEGNSVKFSEEGNVTASNVLSQDFLEWFAGFTDSEGCFRIARKKGNTFEFIFQIRLHIDDKDALIYIKDNLKVGTVIFSLKDHKATFRVSSLKEIALIVAIFSQHLSTSPMNESSTHFKGCVLNTTKYLNFLSFAKAFSLYSQNNNRAYHSCESIKSEIDAVIGSINYQRTEFNLSPDHYQITSNWLLGFIEGDGSFIFSKNNILAISQKGNEELFKAITNYLKQLAPEGIKVSVSINPSGRGDGMFNLLINRTSLIESVVIPMLDGLSWHTKKYLDYCDWKAILLIRKKGLHYLSEGKAIIEQLTNQMNNNRLTTYPKANVSDRTALLAQVDLLLEKPSNYEIREGGRIFIKSLNKYKSTSEPVCMELIEKGKEAADNRGIVEIFDTLTDCAEFLGISPSAVYKRAHKGSHFLFKNKLMYLRRG